MHSHTRERERERVGNQKVTRYTNRMRDMLIKLELIFNEICTTKPGELNPNSSLLVNLYKLYILQTASNPLVQVTKTTYIHPSENILYNCFIKFQPESTPCNEREEGMRSGNMARVTIK